MCISLAVIITGIVLCSIWKDKKSISKFEVYAEIVLFVFGILWLSIALDKGESYQKDVMICLGGASFSISVFCGICSIIA